jgi:sortase A
VSDVGTPVRSPSPAVEGEAAEHAQPRVNGTTADVPRRLRVPSSLEVMRVVGYGLTIFGLVVVAYAVYLFGVTRLEYGRSQRHLMKAMSDQLAAGSAPIGGRIAEGAPVAILEVPRLHLRVATVEGSSGELLKQGPGHLRTSPLPGQRGDSVFMGRRVGYGGPFRNLGDLRKGDRIRVITGQGRATYEVSSVRAAPKGTDVVKKGRGNRLFLVTSSPEVRVKRRLVAMATLRSAPVLTPVGRPVEVGRSELGLQGDGSTVLPLLLWAELLLLAAVGAGWLYRRWSRWSTYLVTTPILALLLLQVFDNLTPILPSTL